MSDKPGRSLETVLERFPPDREHLLPLLQSVQAQWGYVPQEAVGPIAEHFNLSRAEVHGVVTFYHDFHQTPSVGKQVRVCMAEACQAVGARELLKQINRFGAHGATAGSEDSPLSVTPIYCLGLCACGPAMMVDGQLHGRVTQDSLAELLNSGPADD